jgi:hypothetical protein
MQTLALHGSKESCNFLPSGGYLERNVPTLALHGINRDSAGNYHLIDEEFTIGMVIPPGITRSRTRNPPVECLFPPGTRDPSMEWDSTGN